MSQCSHVALNLGEASTVRDKPFAEQRMGCTEATTVCPPDSQGQTPNLLDFDPLTTQDSPPVIQCPLGLHGPGASPQIVNLFIHKGLHPSLWM